MRLQRLIDDTNVTYKLNLDQRKKKTIIASLNVVGYNEEIFGKDVSTVVDIIIAQAKRMPRYNPLKAAVIKANVENKCPICGKIMDDVTIANNKQAKYCPDHNLTLPIAMDNNEK